MSAPCSTSSSASRTPSTGVGGVLLVGAPVALQRGVDGLAERAVERGGVLRGVGQDRRRRCGRRRRARRGSRATWPSIIPLGPTMSTPASAWAQRHLGVHLERRVVVDPAVGGEHAAVAVVGELVEAQVAHHRERVADLGDHVGDRDVEDAVGVERAASRWRPSRSGMPNSITPPSPSSAASAAALQQRVAGVLDDAGHRGDRPRLGDAPRARTAAAPAGAARARSRRPSAAAPGVVRSRRGRTTGPHARSSVIARSCAFRRPDGLAVRTAW